MHMYTHISIYAYRCRDEHRRDLLADMACICIPPRRQVMHLNHTQKKSDASAHACLCIQVLCVCVCMCVCMHACMYIRMPALGMLHVCMHAHEFMRESIKHEYSDTGYRCFYASLYVLSPSPPLSPPRSVSLLPSPSPILSLTSISKQDSGVQIRHRD